MKHLFKALPAVAIACAAFSSCKPVPKEVANITTHDSSGVVIGNPFEYGITDHMIFPVGCNYSPSIFDAPQIAQEIIANGAGCCTFTVNVADVTYDSNTSGGTEYINPYAQYFDIRNILFYNKLNGKTHPLTSDTVHILSFAIHHDYKRPQIFYRIVKKDINNDSIYNELDPVILYTSNLLGDSLTQLTPDNEQYAEYFYYADTQTILVKTNMNPDKDTSFSTVAETNFREIHLGHPEMGREIFSQGLRDSLRVN